MRQHLFAVFKAKYSLLSFYFFKMANFNKPFLEKGSFAGFTFELSKSGGLFEGKSMLPCPSCLDLLMKFVYVIPDRQQDTLGGYICIPSI